MKTVSRHKNNLKLSIMLESKKPVPQCVQPAVSSCLPTHRQIFFALFNVENRDFFSSITKTHIFTAALIMDSKIFINSELAEKFIKDNKLKGFSVCRITPQYSFE